MPCLTLTGYAKGCDQSIGGIKKVFIVERAGLNLTGMTVTLGEVSGLTYVNGFTGYTYDFLKDNSNWTEPLVGDGVLTSVHFEPTITLVFRKMSKTLRNEIYEFTKGSLCAIIRDFNDVYWLVGSQRGLDLTASGGGQSGSKLEELNGYTIVLKGIEPIPAYTVDINTVNVLIKNALTGTLPA